jgi:DNA helicase HerA-like ATPase
MPFDIIIGRDESDKKRFGDRGLVFLGKSFVRMGQYTSLSNPIHMDVARSHVVLVSGKRGSGKSYTLSTIAEELSSLPLEERKNIASLIFDTMGVFWTMKFKNEKEKELLSEWGLKPKNVPVRVFVPFGYFSEFEKRQLPVDSKFSINPAELKAEDWILTFNLDIINPVSVLIQRVISRLKEEREIFYISDIISEIKKDTSTSPEIKNSASSLFEAAETWRLFSVEGEETNISDLVKAGETTVLDLSMYSSVAVFNVRALIIGLISRKLFTERILARKKEELEAVQHGIDYLSFKQERELPLIWLFIDEVHEFIPETGKTPATDALIQLLREGRQPGISLVMATQQPGALHRDAITQSDIVISHRVTALPDIRALNEMMQSYLFESIKKYMDDLPNLKGSAIILDDNSERIYPMRVRPKFTWHGGEAPTAVKVEKRL